MAKKALLIGINYAGTSNALGGCSNDIDNIQNLLKKNGFNREDITIISDVHTDATKTPTKKNILHALTTLIENSRPGDTLIFDYSGHGSQVRDLDRDEPDGKDEVLCTLEKNRDIDIISDDEIKKIILKLPKGVNLFSLMDCCHSESILDLRNSLTIKATQNSNTAQKNIAGYVVELSGCMDHQTSADATIDGQPQGAMTAAFLKMVELYKGFDPVLNAMFNGSIDIIRQFQSTIGSWLAKRGYSQIPRISFEGTPCFTPKSHFSDESHLFTEKPHMLNAYIKSGRALRINVARQSQTEDIYQVPANYATQRSLRSR